MNWSLYCAYTANSFSEKMSFTDFVEKNKAPQTPPKKKPEIGIGNKQMELTIEKSARVLKGFTPPKKER